MSNYGNITPMHRAVYVGQTLNLRCHSKNIPTWIKQGGNIRLSHIIIYNTLCLMNVTEEDSGIYTCQGTGFHDLPFEAQSELLVGGKISLIKIKIYICSYHLYTI